MKQNQFGRSMIEMLGVLAIIAVLSVGGIAGYSKAMEKYKINKAINEYSYLLFGLLEHIDEIKNNPLGTGFSDLAISLKLVPSEWKKVSSRYLTDSLNNVINLKISDQRKFKNMFVFEIYFGRNVHSYKESQHSLHFCRELFNNLAIPLHSSTYAMHLWKQNTSKENSLYYGDSFCSAERKCLRDISVKKIESLCKSCTVDNTGSCSMYFLF